MMKYLIAGLGNIGDEYAATRHNIGFRIVDHYAAQKQATFIDGRYGFTAHLRVKNAEIVLLKPSTFMNLSGMAVRYWLQKENIPTDNLLVIADDLNLPFGTLRLRMKGSDGGHNGLKNIEETIETRDYTRIRLGVGHDFADGAQIDYVLGTLSEEEKEAMPQICEKVIQGVIDWIFVGADRAMNVLNTKNATKKG